MGGDAKISHSWLRGVEVSTAKRVIERGGEADIPVGPLKGVKNRKEHIGLFELLIFHTTPQIWRAPDSLSAKSLSTTDN